MARVAKFSPELFEQNFVVLHPSGSGRPWFMVDVDAPGAMEQFGEFLETWDRPVIQIHDVN